MNGDISMRLMAASVFCKARKYTVRRRRFGRRQRSPASERAKPPPKRGLSGFTTHPQIMSRCQLAERKHNYPEKRKKANRTRQSYRARSAEGRKRQLAALAKGRGKRRKWKPKVETPKVILAGKTKLSRADLQKVNVYSFRDKNDQNVT